MNGFRFSPCLVFVFAACSSNPAQPARTAQAPARARMPSPSPSAQLPAQSATVRISEEIRTLCGVTDDEAYFHFDSSRITEHEHGVLKRVAVCFESGPLEGRTMQLVGHADSRGDSDYNMVLGGSRADAVKSFLHQQGLEEGKMATTSRGELDASGTGEASWEKDRRVDIMLAH